MLLVSLSFVLPLRLKLATPQVSLLLATLEMSLHTATLEVTLHLARRL